ncbi:helicase HerA-like domain-containing protein [Hydrocarboniphaga sp.]|uniref:helicase HerA-like domain-containing protein n=1 Tax=Hydrocarboniphaga sp. TaxID=2033016 RepID=UPI003D0A9E0D
MNIPLLIGKGASVQALDPRYANRHGLIAGATGTGKTLSLQVLAEGFSALGVPVLAVDIKGDLSGIARAGVDSEKIQARAARAGMDGWTQQACPTLFWDVFGRRGHPLRATVSDLGPLLLSRLLELSEVQASVLQLVFRYADDQGLLLLDMKDLRALLTHVAANAKALGADYGLVSSASVAAIQRALLGLDGGDAGTFFGEPALDLHDLLRVDAQGRGLVHLLAADQLFLQPRLYAAVMLWLLGELYEHLPEAGDADKPKLVVFIDEAHLLFKDSSPALVDKVEQVIRLIRSKGVGIYFVTQNPLDLPDSVLGQLGNRVQHALRAFTPRDQKAVRAAAETFRANPAFDVSEAITQLGVGEALVSTLGEGGVPGIVERTMIRPPRSGIGALDEATRAALIAASPLRGRYEQAVDRESAYELLAQRAEKPAAASPDAGWKQDVEDAWGKPTSKPRAPAARRGDSVADAAIKSAVRGLSGTLGREIGRTLLRGLLGSLKR